MLLRANEVTGELCDAIPGIVAKCLHLLRMKNLWKTILHYQRAEEVQNQLTLEAAVVFESLVLEQSSVFCPTKLRSVRNFGVWRRLRRPTQLLRSWLILKLQGLTRRLALTVLQSFGLVPMLLQ